MPPRPPLFLISIRMCLLLYAAVRAFVGLGPVSDCRSRGRPGRQKQKRREHLPEEKRQKEARREGRREEERDGRSEKDKERREDLAIG